MPIKPGSETAFAAPDSTNSGAPDLSVDVLVVGSGAAGLTAAIVAARSGRRVLVIEKTRYFGGTTALSGGGLWVPNNHHMADISVTDTLAMADIYLRAVLGTSFDESKMKAYLQAAPQMVKYLESNTEVKFHAAPVPDYEPDAPGWNVGRSILSVTYDGKQLGKDLHQLRPPLPQMGVLGMQVGLTDIPRLRNFSLSLRDFGFSAKLYLTHLLEQCFLGRATRLVNGNALAGRLLRSARKNGVLLWNNAAATRLLMTDKIATGMIIERDGESRTVTARDGIVLATGGFGANTRMRKAHLPMAENGWGLQPDGIDGDGINLAVSVGGQLVTDNHANAIWVPVSSMLNRQKKRVVFPHAMLDRHCPGSIIVDVTGKRFINEGFHYQHFGNFVRRKNIDRCFLIADHAFLRKYGMGMVKSKPFPIGRFLRNGYLIEATSIIELATKLGIDPAALSTTISDFNHYAEQGLDPAFHRGEDKYSQFMGDASHKPNPSLGVIAAAPFYAVELRPGEFCTIAGLATDSDARVLDSGGSPIEHLYAAGNDMNTAWRGAYPGGGAGLGPAMTFGYLAALHVLKHHHESDHTRIH